MTPTNERRDMNTNVMEQLRLKAKAKPKRVVLPEAGEEKILHAARRVRRDCLSHTHR